MNPKDLEGLRRAIDVAASARRHGNRPFGAVLVDASGAELLVGENTQLTERDCTGHAETNLLREATRRFDRATLAGTTLYASCEPCGMCAGAIFWSGVGRLVYALSSDTLRALAGPSPDELHLSVREVLAAGRRRVEVEGPAIEEEAKAVFDGFFADGERTPG